MAVSSDNATIYATDRTLNRIYKSINAGSSWTELSTGDNVTEPQYIAVAPDNSDIAAFIADGNEVYVTLNGGDTWVTTGNVQQYGGNEAEILGDIAVSGNASGIYYIAVAGNEAGPSAAVWYLDIGVTLPSWHQTNDLPGFTTGSDQAAALAFNNDTANLLLSTVTVEYDLAAGADYVRFEVFSFSSLSWNESAGFSGYPVTVAEDDGITGIEAASVTLSPDYAASCPDSRVALVGLTVEGDSSAVYLSGVHGLYDTFVTPLLENTAIGTLDYNGTTVTAGEYGGTRVYTGDLYTSGLFPPSIEVPGENRVVLANTYGTKFLAGTSGEGGTVSLTDNPTDDFTPTGYPGSSVTDLSATGDTVYAIDGAANQVYASSDNGTSWSMIDKPAEAATPLIIGTAFDNASLIAIVADDNEVYLSADGGDTWEDLGTPPGMVTITDIDISPQVADECNCIAVSGNNGSYGQIWTYEYGGAGIWTESSALDGFNTTALIGYGYPDNCLAVAFSPNFPADYTLTAVTVNDTSTLLELCSLNTMAWNRHAFGYEYPAHIQTDGNDITDANGASISLAPDYFAGDEALRLAFVGLRTESSPSGGIYRLNDYEVTVLKTGVNINDVAFDGTHLMAGEYDTNTVWRTALPFVSEMYRVWPHLWVNFSHAYSHKHPAGESISCIAWAADTILAGTTGNESCFSVSINDGISFSDRSLIDTELTALDDIAVSLEGTISYLVTNDGADTSLWRNDAGNWQRVLNIQGQTGYMVRLSPEDANEIWLCKTHGTEMLTSQDGGLIRWYLRAAPAPMQDFTMESYTNGYLMAVDGAIYRTATAGFVWYAPLNRMYHSGDITEFQAVTTSVDNEWRAIIADDTEIYLNAGRLTFEDALKVETVSIAPPIDTEDYDLYYVASGGTKTGGTAGIWIFPLGTIIPELEDATSYPGMQAGTTAVLAIAFSPDFLNDHTMMAVTTDGTDTYLELLYLDDTPAWNAAAGFGAYPVTLTNGDASISATAASIALGPDFSGLTDTTRSAFIGIRSDGTENGGIYRLMEDTAVVLKAGTDINSISYNGTALAAGEYASNQVWRSANPCDISPVTVNSTTPPSGENKAVVLHSGTTLFAGTSGEASAFSVSYDGGASFSTLSYDNPGTDVTGFTVNGDTLLLLDRESNLLTVSTDAGQSWAFRSSEGYGHTIASVGTGEIVTGSVDGLISFTSDGGTMWHYINSPLESGAQLTQVAATGLSDEDFLFGASSASAGVYRWKISDYSNWEDMAAPVPDGYGIYGMVYADSALYVLASDNASESVLLKSGNPCGSSVMWNELGSIAETFTAMPSALKMSPDGRKLWAIGSTNDTLYSLTDISTPQDDPPDQDPPVSGAPSGGGSAATDDKRFTNISGSSTIDGRLWEEVVVLSVDIDLELTLPSGTLILNANDFPTNAITVTTLGDGGSPPDGFAFLGNVFDLLPEGLTFDPAVQLKLYYKDINLPEGINEQSLRINTWNEKTQTWEPLDCTVDPDTNCVTAMISHFSRYALISGTRPASFTVDSLHLDPAEFYEGETVAVTAGIANDGDLAGNYEAILAIDGQQQQSKSVNLAGGEHRTISFTVKAGEPGSYTLRIGNSQTTFDVIVSDQSSDPGVDHEPAPADFTISEVLASPATAVVDETVTITSVVRNIGESSGTYTVTLKIDGITEDSRDITLPGGLSSEVTFTVARSQAGNYEVECNGKTCQITFTAPELSTTDTSDVETGIDDTNESHISWSLIAFIIGGVVVVGLVTVLIVIRRRNAY